MSRKPPFIFVTASSAVLVSTDLQRNYYRRPFSLHHSFVRFPKSLNGKCQQAGQTSDDQLQKQRFTN
jgi:hypothetical protein